MKIIPFQDFIRRYFSGEEFVVFDTETAGLNTYHDEIIEVGATIWTKDGARDSFQELMYVNENRICPGARAVHKIEQSEINTARQPKEVLADFVKFCGKRVLIAHNIRFDYPMLNSNLIRHGLLPYPNDEVACTLAYAKEQQLPGKLSELAKHYRVTTDGDSLHRALYDVKVTTKVLSKVMKENEPAGMQYSLIL